MEREKYNKYIIGTGIGLQDVDKLQNSQYFLNETEKYINGDITLEELDRLICSYYQRNPKDGNRTAEADIVSVRIAKILADDSFTFTTGQLQTIHKTLFEGLLEHPGELRRYNFSKKEWVLDGDSVTYGDYRDLAMTLQYDFEQEKRYRYAGLSMDEVIDHLAIFVADLWKIHAFEEGNTRTTAVFFIEYLRSLGFDVTNDTFAKNAWYFRNSLVVANYNNIAKGIFADRSYLIKFLKNLLLGEDNILKNRDLHAMRNRPSNGNISRESRVLSLLKEKPTITADQLAQEIGVSPRTIKSVLKGLENEKKIKRINGKRYGHWEIQ